MNRAIPIVLRGIIGLVFILSGVSKLYPIEIFELNLVYDGLIGWTLAPIAARVLIASEITLGIFLIINFRIKKNTLPTAFVLTIFFSFYLIYKLISEGNSGNCHCFGSLLPMTPLESLIKNVLILIGIVYLYSSNTVEITLRYKKILYLVWPIISIVIFILFPIRPFTPRVVSENKVRQAHFLQLKNFSNGVQVDLAEGKKLVAFISLSCIHCKELAFKLGIIHKRYKLPDTYFIYYGDEDELTTFSSETKTSFPHIILPYHDFLNLSGPVLPKLYYLENGMIQKEWDNETFHPEILVEILTKKQVVF